MRPVADIPREFWDDPADLGARLPLLDLWLRGVAPQAPLGGTTILLVQHQLANHAAQAEGLIRLGAEPERIHWLDIPYTSQPAVRNYVHEKLAVPKSHFRVCDDYRVLAPYAPYQLRRAVETVLGLAEAAEAPLLVLDDGAYVLEALAWIRRDRWPERIAIVEQTTRGLIKMKGSAAIQAATEQVPCVDVAGSVAKRTLEPPFIAMSVCASLDRAVRTRHGKSAFGRCLVLGYGAIGEQVATFLDRHFGVGKTRIHVFDSTPERTARALRRGFQPWRREDRQTRFDFVVGCSGRASFGVDDYVYLEDGALLASASSGAVELSRQEFIELSDASVVDDVRIERSSLDERDLHSDLSFTLVDRHATVLNAGFPVNFDGRVSSTPGRFIQATTVMMLSAAVQARRALDEQRRGLADLEGSTCEWLDREFRIVLGADAHYLMPPPEEAW